MKVISNTIAAVHKDFNTFEDRLQQKIRMTSLSAAEEALLKTKGFKARHESREIIQEQWVQFYKRVAPMYKFISHNELHRLCRKYNLVFGEPDLFAEIIPAENARDILQFRVLDTSILPGKTKLPTTWRGKDQIYVIKEMEYSHLKNCIPIAQNLGMATAAQAMIRECGIRDGQYKPEFEQFADYDTEFIIVATVDQFDENIDVVNNEVKRRRSANPAPAPSVRIWDDPVVLAKVEHGWLVVTMWGDDIPLQAKIDLTDSSSN